MIDLYTFTTPNGYKASIMLEELEVPYRLHKVDISKGDQYKPDFLHISPNNKIPALVDNDGPGGEPISVFESGAILIYLADKYGKLLSKDTAQRFNTLKWLFWQVGSVGPMFGQMGHFVRFAKEDIPYAKERYTKETERLLGVLERQLGATGGWLAGAEMTIADIATAPWVGALEFYGKGELLDAYPRTTGWLETFKARPGVQRGMNISFE
ncbi:MAG: glutathione S-transferase C-terminal domain-containing protein [Myxococcota bacterium]